MRAIIIPEKEFLEKKNAFLEKLKLIYHEEQSNMTSAELHRHYHYHVCVFLDQFTK